MKTIYITLFLFLVSTISYAQSGTKTGSINAASLNEFTIDINRGMKIIIEGVEGLDEISYSYDFDGNKAAYERFF